jgi:hypothetical protein
MDYQDSNKRFKAANGQAVPMYASGAANLPAYQPPSAIRNTMNGTGRSTHLYVSGFSLGQDWEGSVQMDALLPPCVSNTVSFIY